MFQNKISNVTIMLHINFMNKISNVTIMLHINFMNVVLPASKPVLFYETHRKILYQIACIILRTIKYHA